MQVLQSTLDFLVSWEGLSEKTLHPYKDVAGVWTIGIGTTFYPGGTPVRASDPPITREKAYEYATTTINNTFIPGIQKYIHVSLNQNQVDALISFVYNEGVGSLNGTGIQKAINNGASSAVITSEFNKWVYVDHKVNSWQVKRRAGEAKLFCS